jgi:hypothetical protein
MEERPGSHMSSRSAQGAAIRHEDRHPDVEIEHQPPSAPPDDQAGVPNRHSASAEAAALRWEERQSDE